MLPQTPSRFTGTIGASTPFIIRSMPRRKGQQLADAGDLAFGENADDFAVADGVAGFAQGMDHVARAELRRNGNGANHFGEGLDVRLVVDVLEHEETDGAIGGGDEEERVHERHVIGNEESAAGFGDVVAAFDADAVDGVGDHEEDQAQEGIGQQINRIGGGDEREDGAVEKNAGGSLVQDRGEEKVRASGQKNAYEREQVRRRDHAALFCGAGAMLDQRIERDGEEAAEETEEPEIGYAQAHDVDDEICQALSERDAGCDVVSCSQPASASAGRSK